jgi:hypothetical protein
VVAFVMRLGKLLLLLCFRIGLQPVIVGCIVDVACIPAIGGSVALRVAFMRQLPLSFILVHWMIGITFLLLSAAYLLQASRWCVSCCALGANTWLVVAAARSAASSYCGQVDQAPGSEP